MEKSALIAGSVYSIKYCNDLQAAYYTGQLNNHQRCGVLEYAVIVIFTCIDMQKMGNLENRKMYVFTLYLHADCC